MFEDVIRVYEDSDDLDIFAYKTEDFLDDIRKLTTSESCSLDVRIAHNMMN